MLNHLKITNLALIKNIEFDLEDGFCVFTGETGAGKSVLMGAIGMLLGNRASSETVRNGETQAEVVGSFSFEKIPENLQKILDENNIDTSDNSLIIKRIIATESSKNKILLNGEVVSLATLKSVGDTIIDLHGQHDHQLLLNENAPFIIIDKIKEVADEKKIFVSSWEAYTAAEKELISFTKKTDELKKKEEFLRFEYESIERLELKDNEEEELEREHSFLSSLADRLNTAAQINQILDGDDSANGIISGLGNLIKLLQYMENNDKSFGEWSDDIKPLADTLKELSKTVGKYESANAADENSTQKLDFINERIAAIQKLKKKHGTDFDGLLKKKEELHAELEAIENCDEDLAELAKIVENLKNVLMISAEDLSVLRKNVCARLDAAITSEMARLGFSDGAFKTQILNKERIDASGKDEIIFTVRTNSGEQFLPLAKTASGGEISRIMLAIKTVLAENDTVPIMVFDEIDTGIGGERASDIAKVIKKLAKNHQILVISHLHQIASLADWQYSVYKIEINGRIQTRIEKLENSERVKEIARMLGGENEATLRHALELLRNSANNILQNDFS